MLEGREGRKGVRAEMKQKGRNDELDSRDEVV